MKRIFRILPCLLALGSVPSRLLAQDETATSQPAATSRPEDEGKKPEMMSLMPVLPRYDGNLWERSVLTGDWGGSRTELAEQGFTFDIGLTQIIQGNAYGGKHTHNAFRYSGSVDYSFTFDTARMGLWPGGQLFVKGETQFGQSINGKVGSLMSSNADALFPVPDDSGITTLTDVTYTQFFSEHFGFALGKVDFRGGDQNVFAHSETEQFMNLSLLANPLLLQFAPYSALTATVIIRPTDWLMTTFTVLDTRGSPTHSGFSTAFHSPKGTSLFNEWNLTVKPFGLPGHQRVGAVWTSKETSVFQSSPQIPPLAVLRRLFGDTETKSGNYALYYNFDQYFYVEPDDNEQGIGVFGRFGWAPENTNAMTTFYSIGVGGKGLVPKRDHDTFGVGYYYLNMSKDLPEFLGFSSEQGIELYYNIEVTPWLHITPDLQFIIDPGAGSLGEDLAIAFGVRMQMSF